MRLRFTFQAFALVLAVASASSVGCNAITGIGNLTFTDSPSEGGTDASPEGDGGLPPGTVLPSGDHAVTSSSLVLRGMTSDGFVVYGDLGSNTVSALGVEQPSGGPPASSTPIALGAANIATTYVLGELAFFFSPSSEADAGPSQVGSLNVWSSTLGVPKAVASDVLEAVTYFTFAASPDGQYIAYLGGVASDGATASLVLLNVASGVKTNLVASIDVLTDTCQPRLAFRAGYLVASYCQVPPGGSVGAGTFLATVSSFVPSSGQATTLATNVDSEFAIDPSGVAAVMLNANGLVASPPSGAGGLVSIDTGVKSWIISDDGRTVVYTTTANALKRASTSAPANPTQLAPSAFASMAGISPDGTWALGALTSGTQAGTSDLYVTSTTAAGTVSTLSSATTASSDLAGDSFTADSKYAVFLTGVTSSLTGTLMVDRLGVGSAPSPLGPNAYQDVAIGGSQLVYNVNDVNGKADLQWLDLAQGPIPTVVVTQADETFLLGPAKDKIVYTYSSGGGASDGLWIASVPGKNGAPETCQDAGPIAYHPPAGRPGSCTPSQVSTYDSECVSSATGSSGCTGIESTIGTTCYTCLESTLGSHAWGVVVQNPGGGGIVQLNMGGCFAAQGDTACGAAAEAQLECENNACASQASITDFNTCQAAVDTAACACYVYDAQAACGGFPTSACNLSTSSTATFETQFLAYAQIMCE